MSTNMRSFRFELTDSTDPIDEATASAIRDSLAVYLGMTSTTLADDSRYQFRLAPGGQVHLLNSRGNTLDIIPVRDVERLLHKTRKGLTIVASEGSL